MNLSRHPMHKIHQDHKEDREEQHQWLEGIKNTCAITVEWMDKTNLRDNPRGILSIHEESSLEFENEINNSEHESYFINTSPSPCSYKTSPQSIDLSNITTFEISNPLFLSILFIKTLKGRLSMHMSIINIADLVDLILI